MRIGRITIITAALLTLASLGANQSAQAAAPLKLESITQSHTSVTVGANTVVKVRESITYDFGTAKHHGILRDISLSRKVDGKPLRITVGAVTVDGKAGQFTQTRDSAVHLRIGNPDKLITGEHTYVIKYTVRGALKTVGTDVQLIWEFVGTGWAVATNKASGTVRGPSEVLSSECFHGVDGVNEPCETSGTARQANFGPVHLAPNEGLTGITVFKGSGFTTKP